MHTTESIKALLDANDHAVIRAMFAIQKRQTDDEQAGHITKHTNGVGWSKFDAEWMGDMIDKYHRWGSLTAKQLAVTRNKVKRYHRQLLEIANERQSGVTAASPATMESVSPDGVHEGEGAYRRLESACDCENYDGERLCPRCERIAEKTAFAEAEARQEARAARYDPDLGAF